MKLIDKSALVAEIERRVTEGEKVAKEIPSSAIMGLIQAYNNTLSFIDTLEVKEVDLEKAIDDYIYTHYGRKRLALELDWKCCNLTLKGGDEIIEFAKHFFELGMRVSNPITAADRGTAEEIIINLKRVENDYRLNLTKEIEWVRNQVKKENSYGTIY